MSAWTIVTVVAFSLSAAGADEFFLSNSVPAIIFKYDAAGVRTEFAREGIYNPLGVAVDGSGNVYVAHDGSTPGQNSAISKFDPNGKPSVFAEMPGWYPTQLAFSPDGDLYVSEGLGPIYRFDKNGHGTLFANLPNSGGMAFDQSGNLYVTSNNTIVRFDTSGTPTVVVSTGLAGPVGLAFDSRGNLFVSNSQTYTIVKITPGGVQSVFAGPSEGLYVPLGLAFDSDDFLYVVNYVGNSIVKLDPEGKARPFATAGLNRPRFITFRPAQLFGGKIARIGASQYRISFQGDPGRSYAIQYRTDLMGEEPWQLLVTRLADSHGHYSTVDQLPPATPARFYRAVALDVMSKSSGAAIR